MYKAMMEVKVNAEYGFVKKEAFEQLHKEAMGRAVEMFEKRATIGRKEIVDEYRQMMMKLIDEARESYWEQNQTRDPLTLISAYIVEMEMENDRCRYLW